MPQKYPHMLKNEIPLWERYLADHAPEYDRFEYDVHVGPMWKRHLGLEPKWRRGAAAVYQKRIDAVGFRSDKVTIFEVKPRAGLAALGQVLGYIALYDEDFSPERDLDAVVITGLVDPAMRQLLDSHGIGVYIYGDV